jgi:hypothetical protein
MAVALRRPFAKSDDRASTLRRMELLDAAAGRRREFANYDLRLAPRSIPDSVAASREGATGQHEKTSGVAPPVLRYFVPRHGNDLIAWKGPFGTQTGLPRWWYALGPRRFLTAFVLSATAVQDSLVGLTSSVSPPGL